MKFSPRVCDPSLFSRLPVTQFPVSMIHSGNVKMPDPLFFQNNLTFVIQMLINVFPRIVFDRTFFFALKS